MTPVYTNHSAVFVSGGIKDVTIEFNHIHSHNEPTVSASGKGLEDKNITVVEQAAAVVMTRQMAITLRDALTACIEESEKADENGQGFPFKKR